MLSLKSGEKFIYWCHLVVIMKPKIVNMGHYSFFPMERAKVDNMISNKQIYSPRFNNLEEGLNERIEFEDFKKSLGSPYMMMDMYSGDCFKI